MNDAKAMQIGAVPAAGTSELAGIDFRESMRSASGEMGSPISKDGHTPGAEAEMRTDSPEGANGAKRGEVSSVRSASIMGPCASGAATPPMSEVNVETTAQIARPVVMKIPVDVNTTRQIAEGLNVESQGGFSSSTTVVVSPNHGLIAVARPCVKERSRSLVDRSQPWNAKKSSASTTNSATTYTDTALSHAYVCDPTRLVSVVNTTAGWSTDCVTAMTISHASPEGSNYIDAGDLLNSKAMALAQSADPFIGTMIGDTSAIQNSDRSFRIASINGGDSQKYVAPDTIRMAIAGNSISIFEKTDSTCQSKGAVQAPSPADSTEENCDSHRGERPITASRTAGSLAELPDLSASPDLKSYARSVSDPFPRAENTAVDPKSSSSTIIAEPAKSDDTRVAPAKTLAGDTVRSKSTQSDQNEVEALLTASTVDTGNTEYWSGLVTALAADPDHIDPPTNEASVTKVAPTFAKVGVKASNDDTSPAAEVGPSNQTPTTSKKTKSSEDEIRPYDGAPTSDPKASLIVSADDSPRNHPQIATHGTEALAEAATPAAAPSAGPAAKAEKPPEAAATSPSRLLDASSVVNTSQLIQSIGRSEMKIGLHSAEFGNISINTSTTRDAITAQISLSHGELAKAIATYVPEMQARLGNDQVGGIRVDVNGQSIGQGTQGGTPNNPQESLPNRSQEFTRGPETFASTVASGHSAVLAPVSVPSFIGQHSGRLDIRI